jgi:hypothetical protein
MPFLSRMGWVGVLVLAGGCASAQTAHMEVLYGKPYVDVLVNGQGPFRFVVDTGTGADAIVTPALAERLALPAVGKARLMDPSRQGDQRAPMVALERLQVAGVEFAQVAAVNHALPGEDDNCMGLLGFTLFREYLLTLDYANQKLTLERGALEPDGGQSVLPFRMPDGVPIVVLTVAGEQMEAQLDSGGMGLTLPETVAVRLKFVSDPVLFSNAESVATRFQLKVGRLGGDVLLGRYVFERPVVEVHPAFPLVNLGAEPMGQFAVTFDQARLLVRLEAKQTRLRLDELPSRLRLLLAPPVKPEEPKLVPVG